MINRPSVFLYFKWSETIHSGNEAEDPGLNPGLGFNFVVMFFFLFWLLQSAGKYRQQGRNYVVEDGDIVFFKFNAGAGLTAKKK